MKFVHIIAGGSFTRRAAISKFSTLLVVAAMACPVPAMANVIASLPDATVAFQAAISGTTGTFNGTFSSAPNSGCLSSNTACIIENSSTGSATVQAFIRPAPGVTASAQGNSEASSDLRYNFEIIGPVNTSVPLTFTGKITDSGDAFSISVGLNATTNNGLVGISPFTILGFAGQTPPQDISFSVDLGGTNDFTSNTVYQVELFANIGLASNTAPDFGGFGEGTAEIDPVISIDTTFPDANQFSLVFSPDVGNSEASIPEPATLALFGMGLAGLGVISRRRRKVD